ncbi:MAG: hypothetical protein WCK39_00975 [Methanomassiliicoccales archaeon]
MPYINGKNARLFMVCENPNAIVVLTGSVATPATSSATIGVSGAASTVGVGNLGGVDESSHVLHKVPYMEGLSYRIAGEDDSYKPFGCDMECKTPIRKAWELTITKKRTNSAFKKMFEGARLGVKSSTVFHDGTDEFDATVGYRFYLYDGAEWMQFAHGVMDPDGYDERIDQSRLSVETIKFSGNYWSAVVPEANLTASVALL